MTTIIKNGTVVTADLTYKADIAIDVGKLTAIGPASSDDFDSDTRAEDEGTAARTEGPAYRYDRRGVAACDEPPRIYRRQKLAEGMEAAK